MALNEIRCYLEYNKNDNNIKKIMADEKLSYEDAIVFDYQNDFKWISQQFFRETSYIANYIARSLINRKQYNCQLLNIMFCDSTEIKNKCTLYLGNIIEYKFHFNSKEYFLCNEEEKKKVIYKALKEHFPILCEIRKWDSSEFLNALENLKNNNFINNYYIGKKTNKMNGITAQVYCEHKMDRADFYIEFKNTNKEIKKKFFFSCPPSVFDIGMNLGIFGWKDNNTIYLYNNVGTEMRTIKYEE